MYSTTYTEYTAKSDHYQWHIDTLGHGWKWIILVDSIESLIHWPTEQSECDPYNIMWPTYDPHAEVFF